MDADSTISDSELSLQRREAYHAASPAASPKRMSLDERLTLEHGVELSPEPKPHFGGWGGYPQVGCSPTLINC